MYIPLVVGAPVMVPFALRTFTPMIFPFGVLRTFTRSVADTRFEYVGVGIGVGVGICGVGV